MIYRSRQNNYDNDTWATPQPVFDYMNGLYDFDMDVAASDRNHRVSEYYTYEDNGLDREWGAVNWCNPPYSNISPWVDKALSEEGTTVMLVPCSVDTKWFSKALEGGASVMFITDGRISFRHPESGEQAASNTKGSCFVITDGLGVMSTISRGVMYD